MRVAHILPYGVKFPLEKHNGRYEWVIRLATLQASAGLRPVIYSHTESRMQIPGIEWRSISEPLADKTESDLALFRHAFSDHSTDVFHSHFDTLHYQVAHETSKPVIATQHWFPSQSIALTVHQYSRSNVIAVPVTNYMAAVDAVLGIPAAAPIYHGIDLRLFTVTPDVKRDKLLFLGRIAPHKGVREAVEIARSSGQPLDIIGKVNETDNGYWASILPYVDQQHIRYLGSLPHTDVPKAMQHAKALLFPGDNIEAFGQTIVEAEACGTPVLARDIGANSELIVHGKTGFLAKTISELVTAVSMIETFKPAACRRQAEKFDIQNMTNAYTKLYKRLTMPSYRYDPRVLP